VLNSKDQRLFFFMRNILSPGWEMMTIKIRSVFLVKLTGFGQMFKIFKVWAQEVDKEVFSVEFEFLPAHIMLRRPLLILESPD